MKLYVIGKIKSIKSIERLRNFSAIISDYSVIVKNALDYLKESL